ncbi:MAG TPA: hypothetical protein VII78_19650 [Myxococcota bacterium]|jgi:hypothetical protein
MASVATAPSAQRTGFIATPAFDLIFFILAPWLCLVFGVVLLAAPWSNQAAPFMGGDRTRYQLFVAVWIYGHLAAVVFRSHLNGAIFRKHPLRFSVVPIAVYLAMAWSLPVLLFGALLASVWDAYHTSMQNFGLARIYDAKAGNPPERGRALDLWINLTVYIGPLICGASFIPTIEGLRQFEAVGWQAPSALLAWLSAHQPALRSAVLFGGSAFVIYYVFTYFELARRGHRISRQKVALLASTALVTIFAFGVLDWFLGYAITSLYHGLQYFGIVWWTERGHLGEQLRLPNRVLPLALLFAGAIVAAGLGYEAALQAGTREVAGVLQAGGAGPFWLFPIPFTISLMHFWYDGFVWSVRRREV